MGGRCSKTPLLAGFCFERISGCVQMWSSSKSLLEQLKEAYRNKKGEGSFGTVAADQNRL
jgi:hypothetical protein